MKKRISKAFIFIVVLMMVLMPVSKVLAGTITDDTTTDPEIYGIRLVSRTKLPTPPNPPDTYVNVLGATYRVTRTHTIDDAGVATLLTPPVVLGTFTVENAVDNGFVTDVRGIYEVKAITPAPGFLLTDTFTVEFPQMECKDDYRIKPPTVCPGGYVIAPVARQIITVTIKNTRVLGNIHLTKTTDTGAVLPNAVFELWQNSAEDLSESGPWPKFKQYLVTGPTGEFTASDLRAGTYSLYERSVPAPYILDVRPINFTITAKDLGVDPADPTRHLYAQPDNQAFAITNYTPPSISKDVMYEVDEHYESNIGQVFQYHVTLPIPANIATYSAFNVLDILDTRLTLATGKCADDISFVPAGSGTLSCSTLLAPDPDDHEEGTRTQMQIAFDPASLATAGTTNIVITINVFINNTYDPSNPHFGDENTPPDDDWTGYFPNHAVLNYGDGVPNENVRTGTNPGDPNYPGNPGAGEGDPGWAPSRPPSTDPNSGDTPLISPIVWVKPAEGTIRMTKYESDGTTPLAGATFQLFTDATCSTAFLNPASLPVANQPVIVTSAATTGLVDFGRLPLGTYYFKETAVPANYRLIQTCRGPYTLTDAAPQITDLTMINYRTDEHLPDTGTLGSILFLLAGALLIGGGVWFIVRRNQKNKQQG